MYRDDDESKHLIDIHEHIIYLQILEKPRVPLVIDEALFDGEATM